MKATAIWMIPNMKATSGAGKIVSWIANDWQLSTVWTGSTGTAYSVGYTYQSGGGVNGSSVNLTGSPDFAARMRIVGSDLGGGCSGNQYAQFTATAFQGPPAGGSTGLESSNNYLKGCFAGVLDLSIARKINLGGGRSVQLRVDMFNAPNSSQITGRNTTVTLISPTDPVTIVNNQYLPDGTLNQTRLQPKNAGFGAANAWQAARSLQGYIRFSF